MAKTASTNYSAAGTNFVMPSADGDQFDRTDMTLLATAVEGHDHTSTKGLQIPTAGIEDDAVSNAKLANITRGSIKVGGAANAPTDLDAKTSGRILVGDGTDVASVAVSGDATLASSGALTIANSAVTPAKIGTIPAVAVRSAVAQSFGSGSDGYVEFATEDFDTDSMHSNVTNNSRLTATTAGKYVITGTLGFTAANTGRRSARIRYNGTTIIANAVDQSPDSSNVSMLCVSAIYHLAVGDYVELIGEQTSGSALTLGTNQRFGAVWVGP